MQPPPPPPPAVSPAPCSQPRLPAPPAVSAGVQPNGTVPMRPLMRIAVWCQAASCLRLQRTQHTHNPTQYTDVARGLFPSRTPKCMAKEWLAPPGHLLRRNDIQPAEAHGAIAPTLSAPVSSDNSSFLPNLPSLPMGRGHRSKCHTTTVGWLRGTTVGVGRGGGRQTASSRQLLRPEIIPAAYNSTHSWGERVQDGSCG